MACPDWLAAMEVRQLPFNWEASAGGLPSGYRLVSDGVGFIVYWDGVEVTRTINERFARLMLGVLEEMGDPTKWGGVFSNDARRRINRLMRVVPCSRCGSGACVRPSGHLTDLGHAHQERRQAFDDWLTG